MTIRFLVLAFVFLCLFDAALSGLNALVDLFNRQALSRLEIAMSVIHVGHPYRSSIRCSIETNMTAGIIVEPSVWLMSSQ